MPARRCNALLLNQAGTLASASSFRLCPTPPVPALPATTRPADSVGKARGPGVDSVLFARSSLGFAGLLPPPRLLIPTVHPARLALQPPYYRDAAASEQVTALLRRRFPLRPFKGVPGNPLLSQAPTFRMKRCFPAGAPAQIQNDFSPGEVYCSSHNPGILAETKAHYARRADGGPGSRRRAGGVVDCYPASVASHK